MNIDTQKVSLSEFYIDPILLIKKQGFENIPRQGPFFVSITFLKDNAGEYSIFTEKKELYFE